MNKLTSETSRPTVFVATNKLDILKPLQDIFLELHFVPISAPNAQLMKRQMNEEVSAVILDLSLPGSQGFECLDFIKNEFPCIPVIVLSATSQVGEAVSAMKKGAYEYVMKPFEPQKVISIVRQAVNQEINSHDFVLKGTAHLKPPKQFIGDSKTAQRILEQIQIMAPLESTILITGESGVGKGLIARMLHYASPRARGPFISVSCPSLPRELVESELFGHEKGSFTGAHEQRVGRVEMAQGGTLFLDELGELPLDLQPKLLTFLQERSFSRVGGRKNIDVNVRVIAATNANLKERIKERTFREDLYFRLNVLPIHVPPLRERLEDLPLLCQEILAQIAHMRKCPSFTLLEDTFDVLKRHPWTGNIRELENVLERASAFCKNHTITIKDLCPAMMDYARFESSAVPSESQAWIGGVALRELERIAIEQTLLQCQGNKAEAARRLGITEKSIYNKLSYYKMR